MADSLQKEKRLGNHAPLYNKTPVPVGADAASPAELGSVHLTRGHGRFFDIGSAAIFLQQDPLAEKYYNLSPYAYCANNPVNFVDPDGRDVWHLNQDGKITWQERSKEDRLYSVDTEGNRSDDYVTVKDRGILDAFTNKSDVASYTTSANIDDVFKVFKFAADNTNVEWVIHRGEGDQYTIGTKHDKISAGNWEDYGIQKPIASVHSHPDVPTTVKEERGSMSHDWKNARMSYIYFSNSRRLYYIEPQGYMYINTINNYRRFYFGTLNHK